METTKKDLEYYRKNAEEDYLTAPISVLRYITEMEQALRIHDIVEQSEQLGCQFCGTEDGKHGWTDDGEVCPLDRTV